MIRFKFDKNICYLVTKTDHISKVQVHNTQSILNFNFNGRQ